MGDAQKIVTARMIELMRGAQQEYKDELRFQIESQYTGHKNGKIAGWIDDIIDSIQIKDIEYKNGVVKGVVFIPNGNNEARMRVLMHGNPGIGTTGNIFTKPGQTTWDDNMERYEKNNRVPPAKRMPDEFLHDSFIEPDVLKNAGKNAEYPIFLRFLNGSKDIMEQIKQIVAKNAGGK